MAARPTTDAWLTARRSWEADPTETFESVGKVVGVSREAVRKRAEKETWSRPTNLRQINQKAQLQADSKVDVEPSEVDGATSKTREQAAVDVRAAVLSRHRKDWLQHRELYTLQAIANDFEVGKQAKISAEMLLIRQKGERAAYAIDEVGGSGLPVVTYKDLTGRRLILSDVSGVSHSGTTRGYDQHRADCLQSKLND